MTRIQKSQNEECWTLSPNRTNTHSAKHDLWSEGVGDIDDSTGIGREGKKSLDPVGALWNKAPRRMGKKTRQNKKVREDVGTKLRGVRSKRNNYPKNPRHLSRVEQRQKRWSLLSGLGRLPKRSESWSTTQLINSLTFWSTHWPFQPPSREPFWYPSGRYKYRDDRQDHLAGTSCSQKDWVVYYESRNRDPKTRPIYECRCDERLKTKSEKSTRLGYTGLLGELEHLKIKG